MPRNLDFLKPKDRKKYEEIAELELDAIIENDKKYKTNISQNKYKDLYGIPDIPEPPGDDKEKKRENFIYQRNQLFKTLEPFFVSESKVREFILQFVNDLDKTLFISDNLESIGKKLEKIKPVTPQEFEDIIQKMANKDTGLTTVKDKDYIRRLKNIEKMFLSLNPETYQPEQDDTGSSTYQ